MSAKPSIEGVDPTKSDKYGEPRLCRVSLARAPAEILQWVNSRARIADLQNEVVSRIWAAKPMSNIRIDQLRSHMRRAWSVAIGQRIAPATTAMTCVERLIGHLSSEEADEIRCEAQLIRATCLLMQDDNQSALLIAQSSFGAGATPRLMEIGALICRAAQWKLGTTNSGSATIPGFPRGAPAAPSHASIYGMAVDAAIELNALRLGVARRLSLDALRMAENSAGSGSDITLFPATIQAQLAYEQGALDEAELAIRERLSAVRSSGSIETSMRAYTVLIRSSLYREDFEHAFLLLQEAEDLSLQRSWPRMTAGLLLERVTFCLSQERMDAALSCAERLERIAAREPARTGNALDVRHYSQLAQLRLNIALGPTDDHMAALSQLHRDAAAAGHLYHATQLSIDFVLLLLASDQKREALRIFAGILRLAAEAGIFQSLLDRGSKSLVLLREFCQYCLKHAESSDLLPYATRLLAAGESVHRDNTPCKSAFRSAETLTAREASILRLISNGSSNKRVAQTLGIMPETVKSHVKNIFLKLAVKTRAEAVFRAKSLGLICDRP